MNPTAILGALLAAILFAAGAFAYGDRRGYTRSSLEAQEIMDRQKIVAANTLAEATADAATKEREHARYITKLETDHARNQTTIAELAADLRGLSVDGRLRDPNGPRCSSDSATGSDTAATGSGTGGGAETPRLLPAVTGGLLSPELSALITRLAGEADVINDAYALCRAERMQLTD